MKKRARQQKVGRDLAEQARSAIAEELAAEQIGSARNEAEEDLFVLDTQPDDTPTHVTQRPVKRRRATTGKRMTRAQVILAASSQARPMYSGAAYARKSRKVPGPKTIVKATVHSGECEVAVVAAPEDPWAEKPQEPDWVFAKDKPRTRPAGLGRPNRPQIPAVEVDKAGCSYNPDYEHHQDAIAEAVACEMQEQLSKELAPKAPPATVAHEDLECSEMACGLFSEDEDNKGEPSRNSGDALALPVAPEKQRKRKAKRNNAREQHKKLQEQALQAKRELKAQRRDADNSKRLVAEIEVEEEERLRHIRRRQADLAEKATQEPPRLGRHRYKELPVQVLPSDDVTGCLRTLRSTPQVARDRFKSLQKRGIIQVTVQQHWQKPTTRRVTQYEKKETQEQSELQQREIEVLKKHRRKTHRVK